MIVMLKFHDTLTKKNRIFKPIKGKKVLMYGCGPTVYNFVHLGNLRAYVFVDLLKRYLQYSGYNVKHVMNVTDVDDKTIRDSQKSGKSLKEFTEFYEKEFVDDLGFMNIEMPDVMPKATDYISEMVKIIKKLEKKGLAYRADGSIYFKISGSKNYGQLAGLENQLLKENASGRLSVADEYKKEDVNDFVLWKEWRDEDGDVYWDTEIGRGRPGWHIECSAMSIKNLGETFDIHCGGEDLIFPHHTNEIAQSEGATGKKFVNYWLHNAHLLVNGQKMSKSLDNFYTLRDIIEKGYDPLLLRIILIKTHYRHVIDFSFDNFTEAKAIAERFVNFLFNLDLIEREDKNKLNIGKLIDGCEKKFKKAMDDDLNISEAMAAVFDFTNDINKSSDVINVKQAEDIRKFILKIDKVLGFIEKIYDGYLVKLGQKIKNTNVGKLLQQREEARKNKDFKESDVLRFKIQELGFLIEDTKNGSVVRLREW